MPGFEYKWSDDKFLQWSRAWSLWADMKTARAHAPAEINIYDNEIVKENMSYTYGNICQCRNIYFIKFHLS